MAPDTYIYELPDGRRISVAADLCKGASVITYTLDGGRIVDAVIVRPSVQCSRCSKRISALQSALSRLRADDALPLCKDCVTREVTTAYHAKGGRS